MYGRVYELARLGRINEAARSHARAGPEIFDACAVLCCAVQCAGGMLGEARCGRVGEGLWNGIERWGWGEIECRRRGG